MSRQIELTPALRAAIAAVDAAEAMHVPGAESSSVIELPRLRLAAVFLDALRAQEARLERLPATATSRGADLARKPRRRRA